MTIYCILHPKTLSPHVVPTTSPPWIWPSNGQILRGLYQKFWILQLWRFFCYVYMTNYSYICFWWLKIWSCMIFYWCFSFGEWYKLSSFNIMSYLVVGFVFYRIPFDGMFIVKLIRVSTYPLEVFQLVCHYLSFSPFQWHFSP